MKLYDLARGQRFLFKSVHERDSYVFGRLDGAYGYYWRFGDEQSIDTRLYASASTEVEAIDDGRG